MSVTPMVDSVKVENPKNSTRWMTQADFARLIGHQRSWVAQLKKSGRLVLNRTGNRVDAPASLEKIKETRTLSAVTAPATQARIMQAAERREEHHHAEITPAAEENTGSPDYNSARARREHWNAEISQLEYQRAIGSLIPLDEALRGASTLGAAIRARIERFPDSVTPLLVESGADETHAYRVLTESVREVLADVSAALRQHTRQLDKRTQ